SDVCSSDLPTMLLSQGVITSERASDTETAATCESGTSLPYALTRMLSTRPVEARPVRTLTRLWRRASMLLAMRACASCLISLIIAVFPGVAESADYTGNAAPGPGSGTAPDGRHEKGRASAAPGGLAGWRAGLSGGRGPGSRSAGRAGSP